MEQKEQKISLITRSILPRTLLAAGAVTLAVYELNSAEASHRNGRCPRTVEITGSAGKVVGVQVIEKTQNDEIMIANVRVDGTGRAEWDGDSNKTINNSRGWEAYLRFDGKDRSVAERCGRHAHFSIVNVENVQPVSTPIPTQRPSQSAPVRQPEATQTPIPTATPNVQATVEARVSASQVAADATRTKSDQNADATKTALKRDFESTATAISNEKDRAENIGRAVRNVTDGFPWGWAIGAGLLLGLGFAVSRAAERIFGQQPQPVPVLRVHKGHKAQEVEEGKEAQ